jgi:hypothetical protein
MRGAPSWRDVRLAIAAAVWLLGRREALADEAPPEGARPDDALRPVSEAIVAAPSRCGDTGAWAASAAAWLERDRIDRRITIEILEVAGGVRFVVLRDGAPVGERTLEVARLPCDDVRAAIGLGIASAIDVTLLDAWKGPREPDGAPGRPAERAASPREDWVPPDERPRPARQGPRTRIGLEGGLLAGALPRASFVGAAVVDVSVARFVDLRASFLATSDVTATIGDRSGGVVGRSDTGIVAGRGDLCVTGSIVPAVRLRGCAGGFVGATHARGVGVPSPTTAWAPWAGPALRSDLRIAASEAFGVSLGVDGVFPVVRTELAVTDRGRAVGTRALSPAGLAIVLGPSLAF